MGNSQKCRPNVSKFGYPLQQASETPVSAAARPIDIRRQTAYSAGACNASRLQEQTDVLLLALAESAPRL
jgi:hypothetical protein